MNNQEKVTAKCPIRTTLDLIGGKWKLLIIYQLRSSSLRFSELKLLIPDITEKMLVQELKLLCDSNLILRTDYQEKPIRIEYQLTQNGQKVLPLIAHIKDFGIAYMQSI